MLVYLIIGELVILPPLCSGFLRPESLRPAWVGYLAVSMLIMCWPIMLAVMVHGFILGWIATNRQRRR